MIERPEMSSQDRELAERALEARRAPASEAPDARILDDMALTAYLDGTLTVEERDRVEAALTASPAAADLLLAARDGLAAPADGVPEAVVRRAQALVGAPPASTPAGEQSGIGTWLSGLAKAFAPSFGYLPSPLGAALAVLALVVVSATGFELGRAGYGNITGNAQQAEIDDDFGFGEPLDEIL